LRLKQSLELWILEVHIVFVYVEQLDELELVEVANVLEYVAPHYCKEFLILEVSMAIG
jgi:hypothetical protein